MGAFPGFLSAAKAVIAVDAHALGIVRFIGVGAARDRPFLIDLL